jgi:hypothetical protein
MPEWGISIVKREDKGVGVLPNTKNASQMGAFVVFEARSRKGTPKTRPNGVSLVFNGRGGGRETRHVEHTHMACSTCLINKKNTSNTNKTRPYGRAFGVRRVECKYRERTPKTRPKGRVFGVQREGEGVEGPDTWNTPYRRVLRV